MSARSSLGSQPFRTLVVVPRSHADGTFERLCGAQGRGKVKCHDDAVARRAVQLDLRPACNGATTSTVTPHRSLCVAWDSRLVHQGHTHHEGAPGWSPPLLRPRFFRLEEQEAWRQHLEEEGYVVFADILASEEVDEALRLLLNDVRLLAPELRSLAEVEEHHLPRAGSSNDLRSTAGLCHGEFAWHLRTRPAISRVFEALFGLAQGSALTGSVDVVALAPPGSTRAVGGHGKRWLHLDYSPPQGQIWQASFQLFPSTAQSGALWERIGIMICKAPSQWTHRRALHSLLACCATGAASRATAGVTRGLVHDECRHALPGIRRILPELRGAPITAITCSGEGHMSEVAELPYGLLRQATPQEAMKKWSIKQLESLLPPRVLEYIWPRAAGGRHAYGLTEALAARAAMSRAADPRGAAGKKISQAASCRGGAAAVASVLTAPAVDAAELEQGDSPRKRLLGRCAMEPFGKRKTSDGRPRSTECSESQDQADDKLPLHIQGRPFQLLKRVRRTEDNIDVDDDNVEIADANGTRECAVARVESLASNSSGKLGSCSSMTSTPAPKRLKRLPGVSAGATEATTSSVSPHPPRPTPRTPFQAVKEPHEEVGRFHDAVGTRIAFTSNLLRPASCRTGGAFTTSVASARRAPTSLWNAALSVGD